MTHEDHALFVAARLEGRVRRVEYFGTTTWALFPDHPQKTSWIKCDNVENAVRLLKMGY
jgi:hypothetical protein